MILTALILSVKFLTVILITSNGLRWPNDLHIYGFKRLPVMDTFIDPSCLHLPLFIYLYNLALEIERKINFNIHFLNSSLIKAENTTLLLVSHTCLFLPPLPELIHIHTCQFC